MQLPLPNSRRCLAACWELSAVAAEAAAAEEEEAVEEEAVEEEAAEAEAAGWGVVQAAAVTI